MKRRGGNDALRSALAARLEELRPVWVEYAGNHDPAFAASFQAILTETDTALTALETGEAATVRADDLKAALFNINDRGRAKLRETPDDALYVVATSGAFEKAR
jgi:hypothetical protein